MYQQLCISGGGIKGFQILGALCHVNKLYKLKNIDNFIGTSIGSIICYLIIIGYEPFEILKKVIDYDKLNQIGLIPDVIKFTNEGGSFSYNLINELLEKLTIEKIGKYHTLKSLYEHFGKKLTIVTYNLTLKKTEFLSYENNPNLPCLVALRMSSNIPFIFPPFYYEKNIYIDGGIVQNLPIEQLDKNLKTIIICTNPRNNNFNNTNDEFNLISYILDILQIASFELMYSQIDDCKKNDNNNLIMLSYCEFPFFDFSLDKSKKIDLFSNGYNDSTKSFKLC